MDPLNLLKTFFKIGENTQPNIQVLKHGQIIIGKIIKFFPNQTAEIQVGTQRLIAKLEIPLLANQQYWFQVLSDEGKIRLKMIKRKSNENENINELKTPLTYKEPLELSRDGVETFVTKIPLPIGNRTSDLSIQWSGRKLKDGKMDPDHCRILLFVNLEHIGDLFVDLFIQNRIISISCVSEKNDLKKVTAAIIPQLKEKLSNLNYQLSSLSFEQSADFIKNVISTSNKRESYGGVDYRI
jgi:hypothetical protein